MRKYFSYFFRFIRTNGLDTGLPDDALVSFDKRDRIILR